MFSAVVVSLEGDYAVAFSSEDFEECVDFLVNRGSQYYFFPGEFIIDADSNTVVDDPYGGKLRGLPLEEAVRKTAEFLRRELQAGG